MLLFCPFCHHVFRSRAFGASEGAIIKLTNVKVSCERCGRPIDVSGNWKFDVNGIATLLAEPEFTPEILYEIKILIEKAQINNYTHKQFSKEAKKITPKAELLDKYIPSSKMSDFLMVLLTVLLFILQQRNNDSKDKNDKANIDYSVHNTNIINVEPISNKKKKGVYKYSKKRRKR